MLYDLYFIKIQHSPFCWRGVFANGIKITVVDTGKLTGCMGCSFAGSKIRSPFIRSASSIDPTTYFYPLAIDPGGILRTKKCHHSADICCFSYPS